MFEIYDHRLGNSNLFIPLRYIEPEIKNFGFHIVHRTAGPFSIPSDVSRWRFLLNGKAVDGRGLVRDAWNISRIPRKEGQHEVDLGAMVLSDVMHPEKIVYCELAISIKVIEKFYLKLVPTSFLRNLSDGKEKFHLRIDLYSQEEDMAKNGWKRFTTLEEMNRATDIENQPDFVKTLIIRPDYTLQTPDPASNSLDSKNSEQTDS